MRVVYQTVLVFFLFSCSGFPYLSIKTHSIYKISHDHLERTLGYYSLGIWVFGEYWVEVLDNPGTSFPFDEAVWKSIQNGIVHYVDVVDEEGGIHRFGWDWDKNRFREISILEFEGAKLNPFHYIYILLEKKRIPI